MKSNWKSACIAIAMIAVAGFFWACNKDDNGSTGPSPVTFTPAPAPQITMPTSNPTSAPTPPPSEPTLLEIFPGRIWSPEGKSIHAEITNKSGREEWVGFACYEAPKGVDNLHAQKLFDGWITLQLADGENHRFQILLPECVWQCDLFIGRKKPKTPPVYTASELVQHADSERVGLDPPQICEPPPRDTVNVLPPGNPCVDSFLSIGSRVDEGNTLHVAINSSHSGTMNALGVSQGFSSGAHLLTIPIPDPVCGREILVTVETECEKKEITVSTVDCPS
jgi:hypothetical protein